MFWRGTGVREMIEKKAGEWRRGERKEGDIYW
jgi:hypothetical protein